MRNVPVEAELIKAEELGAQQGSERQADGQHHFGRVFAELQFNGCVADVHPEVAQAGREVVQISPDQTQREQFPYKTRQTQHAHAECVGETRKRDFGRNGGVEHPDDEGHERKHHHAADPVQDGDPTGCRQSVRGKVSESVDISELWPLLGWCCRCFGHALLSV